jgi:hypothetical protein
MCIFFPVLAAEVLAHFYPRMIELHNYTPANSKAQKMDNWHTLNRKMLSKIDLTLHEDIIDGIVCNKPGVIEHVLSMIRRKVEETEESGDKRSNLHNPPPFSIGSYPRDLDPIEADFLQPVDANSNHSSSPYYPSGAVRHHHHIDGHLDHIRHPPPAEVRTTDIPSRLPVLSRKNLSHKDYTTPSLPPIVKVSKSNSAPHSHFKEHGTLLSALNPKKTPKPSSITKQISASRRLELAEKDQLIMESQEAIQLLQMKVHRLEHLLQIKDMKIEDLTQKLKSISMTQKSHYPKYRTH